MDRLTEIEIFTAVVEENGFTGAARKLGVSKSSVSKHITSLEGRLGVTLLNRTTRAVSATEAGQNYYHRITRILEEIKDADHMVSAMQHDPQGLLRISAATEFGSYQLADAISEFLKVYPEIDVDVVLENRFIDLTTEDFDVAIRIGHLADSALKARLLAKANLAIVASPAYLEEFGTPAVIDDLSAHRLLNYAVDRSDNMWRFTTLSGAQRLRLTGGLSVNDGQFLLSAVKSGAGLSLLPSFIYAPALAAGEVVELLPDQIIDELGIYAVYPPSAYMQPKLRAFVDFMASYFKGKGPEDWA